MSTSTENPKNDVKVTPTSNPLNITTKNAPNPSTSVFTFFLITLFYFVAKYKTPNSMSTMLNIIYIIAIVSTQISINTALAKSICNNAQSMNVGILATVFPMLFIFGLLQLLLTIFPGWVEPFSNTFGYGMAKLVGLHDLMKRLLVSPQFNAAPEKKIINAVNSIYNDPSIFINQFSYANREDFNKTWDNSFAGGRGIFVKSAGSAPLPYSPANPNPSPGSHLYQEFRNMVKLKDIVGTFVWYMLVGVITTSRSYNYIISQPCSLNASVAQKAVNSYIKNTVAAPKTIDKLTPDGFNYKLN
jgi:hypothetical protein